MLHSSFANKDTNEDPKTSAVFENLMLLPDDIFWAILRESCTDHSALPAVAGRLTGYEFWPHWDPSSTENSRFVEPDVFLRFELFDVIIEAKFGDEGGQYRDQWEREIKAYLNMYEEEHRSVHFLAVGGNTDRFNEQLSVKGRQFTVCKCTWHSILMCADSYGKSLSRLRFTDYATGAQRRILQNVSLAFNINGVYNTLWFDSMAGINLPVSKESICNLKKYFKYE